MQAKIAEQEKAARDAEIAAQARREAEERAAREKAEMEARAAQREAELLARAEREKQEAIERAKAEQTTPPPQAFYDVQREILQKPREAENGKAIYTIRAEFEVKAPANAPHDKLTDKIKEMLAAAGITNLSKIEVLNA